MEIQVKYQKVSVTIFWINTILSIIFLLLLLQLKGPDFGKIESSPVYERYAILATLVGIPLALSLFQSQYKKLLASNYDLENKSKGYLNISITRIAILDVVLGFNYLGFYLYESRNFIFMCVILIFSLMYSFPAKSQWENLDGDCEIESEIEKDNEELINNKEKE